MPWLKDVILDIAVTIVIVVLVATGHEAAFWAIAVYTPLLLLLKIISMVGGSFFKQIQGESEVPDAFYHATYATNTVLLAAGAYWWLAAGWLVIWGLSAWSSR